MFADKDIVIFGIFSQIRQIYCPFENYSLVERLFLRLYRNLRYHHSCINKCRSIILNVCPYILLFLVDI